MYHYNEIVQLDRERFTEFPDFSIRYEGMHDITDGQGGIVTLQTEDYTLRSKDGEEDRLKIGNGQLPNRPRTFTWAGKTFILYTYKTPAGIELKAGECYLEAL